MGATFKKARTLDDIIADAISNGLGDRLALAVALKRARVVLVELEKRCDCPGSHDPAWPCVRRLARHGLGGE